MNWKSFNIELDMRNFHLLFVPFTFNFITPGQLKVRLDVIMKWSPGALNFLAQKKLNGIHDYITKYVKCDDIFFL